MDRLIKGELHYRCHLTRFDIDFKKAINNLMYFNVQIQININHLKIKIMRSIFGQFIEWLASLQSKRFKLFRSARLIHEAYMIKYNVNIENLTPEQQSHAKQSIELNEAEILYNESLELTIADNSTNNISILYQQLGLLYYMRGELDQSYKFYSESLSILQNQPNIGFLQLNAISTCMLYLSLIALNNGDYLLAKTQILKTIEIDKKLNNQLSIEMYNRILKRCEEKL
jgi:tetratricopeptide (TPR) repeat protein